MSTISQRIRAADEIAGQWLIWMLGRLASSLQGLRQAMCMLLQQEQYACRATAHAEVPAGLLGAVIAVDTAAD